MRCPASNVKYKPQCASSDMLLTSNDKQEISSVVWMRMQENFPVEVQVLLVILWIKITFQKKEIKVMNVVYPCPMNGQEADRIRLPATVFSAPYRHMACPYLCRGNWDCYINNSFWQDNKVWLSFHQMIDVLTLTKASCNSACLSIKLASVTSAVLTASSCALLLTYSKQCATASTATHMPVSCGLFHGWRSGHLVIYIENSPERCQLQLLFFFLSMWDFYSIGWSQSCLAFGV